MKEGQKFWKTLINLLGILLGVSCLSVSANVFYAPNDIVVGGFTGLAIVIQSLTAGWIEGGIPLSLTTFVLNIPLFIGAYFYLGKDYMVKTFMATALFSLALHFGKTLPPYIGDYTLVAVFGGLLDGVGVGLVLRAAASTGGVDTLAMLLYRYFKHIGISKIIFILDGAIIVVGSIVFGMEKAMYAIIAVYIISRVIPVVLEGWSFSKAAFIISKESDAIARDIMKLHGRGVTALKGQGMYTKEDKEVLLCVFNQKQITAIKEVVQKHDENAFVIVTNVNEVMGEGFKKIDDLT